VQAPFVALFLKYVSRTKDLSNVALHQLLQCVLRNGVCCLQALTSLC